MGKREIKWKQNLGRTECFHIISSFLNFTSVDIAVCQHGKCFRFLRGPKKGTIASLRQDSEQEERQTCIQA